MERRFCSGSHSCRSLSTVLVGDISIPRALLARGVRRWHQGQAPDGWMEQVMGYTGAVGTMLMDEMAGICGRVEERFTGIRMDIGKLETELLKAWNWSTRA